ncbi:MAG: hypothetical protein ACFFG0_51685, partial [Candidatus Thorarchaeota archaeon]
NNQKREDKSVIKSNEPSLNDKTEQNVDEKGYLDFIVDADKASINFTVTIEKISEDTEEFGKKIDIKLLELKPLTDNPVPGNTIKVHKIARTIAEIMINYSEEIEKNIPSLQENIDIMNESYFGYINWVDLKKENNRDEIIKFRTATENTLNKARDGIKVYNSIYDKAKSLRGISRYLNRASNQLSETIRNFISSMEQIEAMFVKIILLINDKLENN